MITAATSKYVSASSPPTRTTADQQPGRERADRDQRVHRRREMPRALQRRAVEADARSRRRRVSRARARPTPSRRTEAAGPWRSARAAQSARRRRRAAGEDRDRLVVVVMRARASSRDGAWYPAASTAETRSSTRRAGSQCTVACSVAKLTDASTPSSLLSLRSMRSRTTAHVMPSRSRRTSLQAP